MSIDSSKQDSDGGVTGYAIDTSLQEAMQLNSGECHGIEREGDSNDEWGPPETYTDWTKEDIEKNLQEMQLRHTTAMTLVKDKRNASHAAMMAMSEAVERARICERELQQAMIQLRRTEHAIAQCRHAVHEVYLIIHIHTHTSLVHLPYRDFFKTESHCRYWCQPSHCSDLL